MPGRNGGDKRQVKTGAEAGFWVEEIQAPWGDRDQFPQFYEKRSFLNKYNFLE